MTNDDQPSGNLDYLLDDDNYDHQPDEQVVDGTEKQEEPEAADAAKPEDNPEAEKTEPSKAEDGEDGKTEGEGDKAEDGKPPAGYVNKGALDAERNARRNAEAQAREAQARFDELNAKIAKLETATAPDAPKQLHEYTRDELADLQFSDPEKYSDLLIGDAKARNDAQTAAAEQAEKQRESAALLSFAEQSERTFAAENPDYEDAFQHVIAADVQRFVGMGMSEDRARQTVGQRLQEVYQHGQKQGVNPAALVYNAALQAGYQKSQPVDPVAEAAAAQEKAKADTAAKAATAAAAVERKGQHKNLGGLGAGASDVLTVKAINAMSDDEYDSLMSTPEGKKRIVAAMR